MLSPGDPWNVFTKAHEEEIASRKHWCVAPFSLAWDRECFFSLGGMNPGLAQPLLSPDVGYVKNQGKVSMYLLLRGESHLNDIPSIAHTCSTIKDTEWKPQSCFFSLSLEISDHIWIPHLTWEEMQTCCFLEPRAGLMESQPLLPRCPSLCKFCHSLSCVQEGKKWGGGSTFARRGFQLHFTCFAGHRLPEVLQ
jgi:hypothetical protein